MRLHFREVMLAALLWLGVGCGAEAEPPAAEVVYESFDRDPRDLAEIARMTGDVRVRPAESAHWTLGRVGAGLGARDSVQTMEGASATVHFAETGAETVLEAGTTMLIPEQSPRVTRLRHVTGQLRARLDADAEVDRLEVALPPGELVLEQAEAGASGYAEARVEIREDTSEIAMLQGRARFQAQGRAAVTIEERHYVQLDPEAAVIERGEDLPAPSELLQPEPDEEVVTRGAVHLRWASVAGAVGYTVIVEDASGEAQEHREDTNRSTVRLSTGRYTWRVRAVGELGVGHPSPRSAFSVRVDATPPSLTVQAPRPGQIVRGATLVVSGRTDADASVLVDGSPAAVSEDGTFRGQASIPRGLTNIVVIARDPLGNERAVTRSVLRER